MYCDVSHRLIGEVENRERNLTEYNYQEIVKGINRARQAKANGTFEADKKKFEMFTALLKNYPSYGESP